MMTSSYRVEMSKNKFLAPTYQFLAQTNFSVTFIDFFQFSML